MKDENKLSQMVEEPLKEEKKVSFGLSSKRFE
jgi:hypothetical protein